MADKEKQPTLKVMRLYKPKLQVCENLPTDPLLASATQCLDRSFGLSNALLLPDSFGNIYLGETFCSYISVINHFDYDLYDTQLTARMQTPNDRAELKDTRHSRTGLQPLENPVSVFKAGTSLDMVVEHGLKEMGVHTLRVGVSYKESKDGEPRPLRKFYRFNVLTPVNTSTTVSLVQNTTYVEMQLQNVSIFPMYIESMNFITKASITATRVIDENQIISRKHKTEEHDELLESIDVECKSFLGPEETMQQIYIITTTDGTPTKGNVTFGHIDIKWRTSNGELGQLSTSLISRQVSLDSEIKVFFADIPTRVMIGEPFLAKLCIENRSQVPLALKLDMRRHQMKGIFCNSMMKKALGTIQSQGSQTIEIEFLPLVAGLFEIQGVVVVDIHSSKEYTLEKGSHIYIETSPIVP